MLIVKVQEMAKRAVGKPGTVGQQKVDMWMESKKLARRLDEANSSGLYVVGVECREQVQTGGAPSASCKLTQELAIVAEMDAQAFGYSEHYLAVGNLL